MRRATALVMVFIGLLLFVGRADGAPVEGTWDIPTPLTNSEVDQQAPIVVAGSQGDLLAVWTEGTIGNFSIVAARRSPTSGWTAPVVLSNGSGTAYGPAAAISSTGVSVVAWAQWNGVAYQTTTIRFVPGPGWGAPEALGNGSTNHWTQRVAIDAQGNATVVWAQALSAYQGIYVCRYRVSLGWSPVSRLDDGSDNAYGPGIGTDDSGSVTVIWSTGSAVFLSRYEPNSGWTSPAPVGASLGDAWNPILGVAADGNATAVWVTTYPSNPGYYAAQFVPGRGWSLPVRIALPWGSKTDPLLSVSPTGYAVVAWSQQNASDYAYEVWANRYEPSTGWRGEVRLSGSVGPAAVPSPAADGKGSAFVAWQHLGSARFCRGPASGAWLAPTNVTLTGSAASSPQMVALPDRRIVAVWIENWVGGKPNGRIVASTYFADVTPPNLTILTPNHGLTNASVVLVSGVTEADARVAVESLGVPVNLTGYFGTNLTLPDGNHSLSIRATDLEGNGATANVSITVDTAPPRLAFTGPVNGTSVTSAAVVVTGMTEPGAVLWLNGIAVHVEAEGSFSLVVALLPGSNALVATAVDGAENSAEARLNVVFVDPSIALAQAVQGAVDSIAELQSQIAAVAAQVDATWADLNATRAVLATSWEAGNQTEVALRETRTRLVATESNVSVAASRLTNMSTELGIAETDLTALSASLNATTMDISSSRAELEALQGDLNATRAELATVKANLARAESALEDTSIDAVAAGAGAGLAVTMALVAVGCGAAGLALSTMALRREARKTPPLTSVEVRHEGR